MKKWLCLLLCMFIIPSVFVLSACKDKSGYKLSKLNSDFANLTASNQVVKYDTNEGEINFNYSNYKDLNAVLNAEPYKNLTYYNTMLNNMMAFSYDYAGACSTDTLEIEKDTRNLLESQLNELKNSLAVVDKKSCDLGESLDMYEDNYNVICMNRLAKLLESYNDLFIKAYNFNCTLSNVYFSTSLVPNYVNTNVSNFNPLIAMIDFRFDARIKQQIVNTTRVYVEMHVASDAIATSLTRTVEGGTYNHLENYSNYISNIASISRNFDELNLNSVQYNQNFLEYAIEATGIQRTLNNDFAKFNTALNSVNYAELDLKALSDKEQVYATSIENFNFITIKYNTVISKMLNEMGA